MQKTAGKNTITQGVIWKAMMAFFFPILLGAFFQQLYNTVDAFVVGRFVGTAALAAVGGSAAQIMNMIVSFFAGIAGGASVIVSQYYGADEPENLSRSVHTAMIFAFLGGVAFGAAGVLGAETMLEWMNTPEDIMEDSAKYLQIVFLSMPFGMIYNIGSGILRAVGDSRRPLYYLISCCVVNIIFDLVFVLWFKMGVAGVAWATSLAQVISAALVLIRLFNAKESYRMEMRSMKITGVMMKKTLTIGLPAGLNSMMYSLSNALITSSVNALGTVTVASWVAWGKVDLIHWLITGAFGVTMATFAGQNYGARLYGRVKESMRTCTKIALCVSWGVSLLLILFRNPLCSMFSNDPEVIENAARMAWYFAPFYWFFIPQEVIANTMRGLGRTMMSTCINALGICGFRVLWMICVVPKWHSLLSISLSYPISWFLTMLAFIVYYWVVGRKMLREH